MDDINDTAALGVDETSQSEESNAQSKLDALVAARVKAELEKMQPQLHAEIERKAQSLSDKHYARAIKQFNRDKESIGRIAKLENWDAKKVSEMKRAAWDMAFLEQEEEDDAAPQGQAQPAQNTPQAADLAQHKVAIERHIEQVFGIAPGQLDVSPYVGISDANDPRIAQLYAEARKFLMSKSSPRDEELKRTAEEYGGLGAFTVSGTAAANNLIESIDDPDTLWKLAFKKH
jgi:hypothetical protein